MTKRIFTAGVSALGLMAGAAWADQVILDDLIVDGSACIGQDCVNGESFGFDTIRMKENNLRIKAQDTSASASFPTQDWQITFNDSSNGGANKFSIEAIAPSTGTPFTIEAGARTNALYIDSATARVGFGTSSPAADLHARQGNTPTLRLEQDGSSGFGAQTWDVAGNETNFFVRDASNGSTLPLRIEPNTGSNTLYLDSTESVGINTTSPQQKLHIADSTSNTVGIELDSNTATDLAMVWVNDEFRISVQGSGVVEFEITNTGDVEIGNSLNVLGGITTGTAGSCTVATPCDAVFDPAVYTVPAIEDHAAKMWDQKFLPAVGPTTNQTTFNLTHKVTGVINELEHAHIFIQQLNDRIKVLEAALDDQKG